KTRAQNPIVLYSIKAACMKRPFACSANTRQIVRTLVRNSADAAQVLRSLQSGFLGFSSAFSGLIFARRWSGIDRAGQHFFYPIDIFVHWSGGVTWHTED